MIKEKQKTVYSLIISQLRYDGFRDISSQLEDYTCIQTRPKNHLDKLVESVEYQWKITSIFVDDNCIPSLLSKRGSNDNSAKRSFNSESRKTYSKSNRFVSKSCLSNFNSFRECVTHPCVPADAQISEHYRPGPETDHPSVNSSNSEVCNDGSASVSCNNDTLNHSSPDAEINHETDNGTTNLQSQYLTDGMNEFDESDDSSTSLINESDDSIVDLTTDRADDAVHKSNTMHGLENVYQSPYLVSKSTESGSKHADKAISSPKCSSHQMTIKSAQISSDDDSTEVSYSCSKSHAGKSFPKDTKSSFRFPPMTLDKIALIYGIFEGDTVSRTAFKSNVDSIIPSIACCTVEQQLSVMLGEHVSTYFVISENGIRLTKKYGKMTKSGFLSSISSVLGKSEVKTDCDDSHVSNACKINGFNGINPGNAKSDRDLNLQYTVAQQLLSGCDQVSTECKKSESKTTAESSKPVKFSEATIVKIVELMHKSITLSCATFRKKVNQITPTDSYSIHDIISKTFGKSASHYIQFEYKDERLNSIFLKNPWKKKSLVDILDSLNISKSLIQAVGVPQKDTIKSHIAQTGNTVTTETDKKKASEPAMVTKKNIQDEQNNKVNSECDKGECKKPAELSKSATFSEAAKVRIIDLIHQSTTLSSTNFRNKVKQIAPADSYTIHDIICKTFGKNASHYIQYEYKDERLNAIFLKNPWKKKSLVDILNSLNISKSLIPAVEVPKKDTTKSHITQTDNKVNTETDKNKASEPVMVTKKKIQGNQNNNKLNSECDKSKCKKPAELSKSATFSEAAKVKIIHLIHQSTTLLCTDFRKKVNQIVRTNSYTIHDIICKTFGKNASHYIQYEYKDERLNAIFLKSPWKIKSLIDILQSLNISKSVVLQAVDVPKKDTTKKQQLVLSRYQKTTLINMLLSNDSYTFKEFLLIGKSIIPALSVAHSAKDVLIAIFSSQFSHYVQFRHDEDESHLSLKPPWIGKASTEILNSIVSNSTKAEAKVVVLSNNDKLLIIDLIKKGSKTFEAFKAEADSLVASSKLTDFHGLMVSLFGDFITKYVCLENGRICLMKRFKMTPDIGILDSIKQTTRNAKRG